MVLSVNVPGGSCVCAKHPDTVCASGLGALLAPFLWTDGVDFASSQEMPW